MRHEEKKLAKIVEELTMYFFSLGADKIKSEIERMEDKVKITFRANYLPEYESELQYLEDRLNTERRNNGMEDIYWELVGSGDPGESSEMLLLAMMIDEHEIYRFENEVELHLYRKRRMDE